MEESRDNAFRGCLTRGRHDLSNMTASSRRAQCRDCGEWFSYDAAQAAWLSERTLYEIMVDVPAGMGGFDLEARKHRVS